MATAKKDTAEDARRELVRRTVGKDLSPDEFELFWATCESTGLDPLARQIYAVKRYDKKAGKEIMAIQTSIDGYRLIAARTGLLDGQDGPYWCGRDGEWKDVWLSPQPPAAAKVLIYRKGAAHPFTGVARWDSYAQTFKDGNPSGLWGKMGDVMIAKCAESLGLRKAFPAELSGLYTAEEMQQASHGNDQVTSLPDGRQVDTETGEVLGTEVAAKGEPQAAPAPSVAPKASATAAAPAAGTDRTAAQAWADLWKAAKLGAVAVGLRTDKDTVMAALVDIFKTEHGVESQANLTASQLDEIRERIVANPSVLLPTFESPALSTDSDDDIPGFECPEATAYPELWAAIVAAAPDATDAVRVGFLHNLAANRFKAAGGITKITDHGRAELAQMLRDDPKGTLHKFGLPAQAS